MGSKSIKKAALHAVHATVNPTNLLHKDFLQKVAKDAQSGFGVLNDKQARLVGQIAPIVTAFIPGVGPLISAGITAANSFANTGKIGPAVLKGGLSYAGSYLGGNLGAESSLGSQSLGSTLGGAGGMAGNIVNGAESLFGEGAAGSIASGLANNSVGSTLGQFAGSQIGNSIADTATPYITKAQDMTDFHAYQPQQQDASNLPPNLQGFGGLNPDQQSTNIANQGVYGGGLGADEQSYFTNLINRRLVDQGGNVQNIDTLKPIESSYLQKLGLGGYGNSNDLLQAISKWHAA